MKANLILIYSLLNKIPDASTLIHTNQLSTDKQHLERTKMGMLIKNT